MSEQTWSILVGFGVVVGLRLLDYFFPRGWIFKKAKEWSIPPPETPDRRESVPGLPEED